MTELVIGFAIAMILVLALSEDERLGQDNERVWINHLADQSRKRKAPGSRRPCRYVEAGWRPERHG